MCYDQGHETPSTLQTKVEDCHCCESDGAHFWHKRKILIYRVQRARSKFGFVMPNWAPGT